MAEAVLKLDYMSSEGEDEEQPEDRRDILLGWESESLRTLKLKLDTVFRNGASSPQKRLLRNVDKTSDCRISNMKAPNDASDWAVKP